jgi:hypothetical protein
MKVLKEVKIIKEADRLIKNNFTTLSILKTQKRDNPNIIALMLCELYFSSPGKRAIEYLAWLFFTLIKSNKRYSISVGVSQIQTRHWLSHKFISASGSLKNIFAFLNIISNYDLIEILFKDYDLKSIDNSRLLAIYRGETRSYHLTLFNTLKRTLTNNISE